MTERRDVLDYLTDIADGLKPHAASRSTCERVIRMFPGG